MFLGGELDGQLVAAPAQGLTPTGGSSVEMRMKAHFGNLMSMMAMLEHHSELGERVAEKFIDYCEMCRTQVVEALMPRQRREAGSQETP